MKEFSLLLPPKILFGFGSLGRLGSVLKGENVLVVTGKNSMKKSGALSWVLDIINKSKKKSFVFSGVEPEVSVETVDSCASYAKQNNIDCIIGLGGGSTLDCAKAAAGIFKDDLSVAEYLDDKAKITKRGAYFIAIPTTAGTGSEATKNSVLTYTAKGIKTSLRGDSLIPDAVIADPQLTLTMPPAITAYSGMDALSHAVESYFSVSANEFTKALSMRAIEMIFSSMLRAYKNGKSRQARHNMLLASVTAGMAFANAGLGAVHGIGHPVGAALKMPHGLVNAVLMPYVLGFNAKKSRKAFAQLNKKLGFDIVKGIKALNKKMGIPAKLSGIDKKANDKTGLVMEKIVYTGSMAYNSVKMDDKKVLKILKEAV